MAKGKESKKNSALNIKQEMFCLEYVKASGNATEAYRRAYPGSEKWTPPSLYAKASNLLAQDKVRIRIEAIRAATVHRGVMSAAEALEEVTRLARFDIRKLYRADGSPIPIQDLDEDTARCVAGVDIHEEYSGAGEGRVFVGYTKKYKIADKNAALEKLLKHHGQYEKDNMQKHPIAEMTDEQLQRFVERKMAEAGVVQH